MKYEIKQIVQVRDRYAPDFNQIVPNKYINGMIIDLFEFQDIQTAKILVSGKHEFIEPVDMLCLNCSKCKYNLIDYSTGYTGCYFD